MTRHASARRPSPLPLVLVALWVAAPACGDDATPSTQGDAGTGDAGALDAGEGTRDSALDASVPMPDAAQPDSDASARSCAEIVARDLELDVDTEGDDGQIHAALAFDAETLWIVYAEPEAGDTGLFDVRARRFACDGAPRGPSFAVQESSEGNDVDPEVALGSDGALIVWTKDDGSGGSANMQAYVRAFSRDAEPSGAERRLTTERDGMPVTDNHLDARLVAVPGGYLFAGVRALPEVLRFQAFVQPLDDEGALRAPARDVLVETAVTHGSPAIAAHADDDGWIAYEREPDGSADPQVMIARLDGAPPARASNELESTRSPSLALDSTDPTRAWLAFAGEVLSGEVDVWLIDASAPEPTRTFVRVGERRELEHGPTVIADDRGGGALAWYRSTSGIRNTLWVARFASDASAGLRAAAPVLVASDVPPYPVAIAHVAGDVFVLAYAQGTSPAFRLRARWLVLPPP